MPVIQVIINLFTVILFLLLIILIFILCFYSFFCLFQIYLFIRKDTIPFLSTSSREVNQNLKKIFSKYLDAEPDTQKPAFVELGCGLANILGWVKKNQSSYFREFIGVDIDYSIIACAKLWNFLKRQKVSLKRHNIFEYDIPKNSVLYCYLGTNIMDMLYKQGKLKGFLVISTTFAITEAEADQKFKLSNFYNSLYVYDFRSQA